MLKKAQALKDIPSAELPKVTKDQAILLNKHFDTPKTSMIIFHFEPESFASPKLRLEHCSYERASIKGKDVYVFDDFFTEAESLELREVTKKAQFSRSIYADHESNEKGEIPSRSMDNKERWMFFANPPKAIKELYKLLGLMAEELKTDITTLPWDLCDANICAPAFATNWIEHRSAESSKLGRHKDYNTEKGVAFGIPILYSKEKEFYPVQFMNGETNKPWLVSLMVYTMDENFRPEYGMGTGFFSENGEKILDVECHNMRVILFEGDIVHSIEKSTVPDDVKTWRVSYVFKLCLNPKEPNANIKKDFFELIQKYKEGQ